MPAVHHCAVLSAALFFSSPRDLTCPSHRRRSDRVCTATRRQQQHTARWLSTSAPTSTALPLPALPLLPAPVRLSPSARPLHAASLGSWRRRAVGQLDAGTIGRGAVHSAVHRGAGSRGIAQRSAHCSSSLSLCSAPLCLCAVRVCVPVSSHASHPSAPRSRRCTLPCLLLTSVPPLLSITRTLTHRRLLLLRTARWCPP